MLSKTDIVSISDAPKCPVLGFINSQSCGQLGGVLLVTYGSVLSEHQIYELGEQSPDKILNKIFMNLESLKNDCDELAAKIHERLQIIAHHVCIEFHKGAGDHTFMRIEGEPWKQPLQVDDGTVVVEKSHLDQVNMLATHDCSSKSIHDPSFLLAMRMRKRKVMRKTLYEEKSGGSLVQLTRSRFQMELIFLISGKPSNLICFFIL
ncbi:diacylglycerol kinase 5 [Tripterygium wilfordii]|uniref:Diacylglycerol kinase 5 n=1 Tax=Tripterygium wilfordii TaxID=458696 RepID=A0A7J7BX66_TRIWF|nr:diacylglycerol kinase 5 [Tripterygium wilfordii]